MTHICVSDLTIIGSDNGLSPGRRQAIIRTNAGILLKRPLGTNFSEILIKILLFSFKKMHLKVSSAKRRPFCLGLNVLRSGAWVPLNSFCFFLCFFFSFFCLFEWSYVPLVQILSRICTGPVYKVLLSFMVISDVYMSFIPIETTFINYCQSFLLSGF